MNAAATLRMFELDGRAVWRRRVSLMLLMRIERWDVRRDGPLTEAALRQKIEALGYQPAPCSYPPGAVVAAQSDARERLHGVVRGLIKITIDGEAAILAPGDIVYVPLGAVRRVEVVGASAAHYFEAIFDRGSE